MATAQFRILYRDFLRRMFDVEMLSADAPDSASALLGQVATFLICVSILLVLPVGAFDGRISGPLFLFGSWSFQHFLIATTMVIIGLFAVLNWNTSFPEKRAMLWFCALTRALPNYLRGEDRIHRNRIGSCGIGTPYFGWK